MLEIYRITKFFPKDERFGFISQMRRCSVSITSNIAEGFSRQSYKNKIQFYSISLGSVTELQNQLDIVRDLKFIDLNTYQASESTLEELRLLINGLIKSSISRIPKQ